MGEFRGLDNPDLRFTFYNFQQAFPDAILGLDGFTLPTLEVIVPSAYRRDWLIKYEPLLSERKR